MFPQLTPNYLDPSVSLWLQTEDVLLASLGWAEARGEITKVGYAGPLAVMNVVLNRKFRSAKSLTDIILASTVVNGRRIWQFSCWSQDDPRTPAKEPTDPNYTGLFRLKTSASQSYYNSCWHLAVGLLNGLLPYDPTYGATNYYNPTIASPAWGRGSPGWKETVQIGSHVFGRAQ